jgi:sortase A
MLLLVMVGLPRLPRVPAPSIVVADITPTPDAAPVRPTEKPVVAVILPSATSVPTVAQVEGSTTAPARVAAAGPSIVSLTSPTPAPIAQAPTLLPDDRPATPTRNPQPTAQATQAPPKKATPTPAPPRAQDPSLLPNGVRYGDPRPNLADRIVRIASPDIKLDTSAYEVYLDKKSNTWQVADYAAGHNYNSANPGEGGNIVLSGHNNWRGEVFRYLEFLKPGNTIKLWTLEGKEYDYRVTDIQKLQEAGASMDQRLKNAQVMNPTDHEQLTLITCWPYTTYTHRLIVTALPVK